MTQKSEKSVKPDSREARLASAMRQNLRRRKTQARQKAETDVQSDGQDAEPPQAPTVDPT